MTPNISFHDLVNRVIKLREHNRIIECNVLPHDATHKRGLLRRAVSVCLSVCPAVCHVRVVRQNELRYLQTFFTVE